MTTLEICFNNEMELAHRMRRTDHDYWAGYSIGLLNGYFQSRVIPPALHAWLLAQPDLNTKARGYRAGFRFMTLFGGEPEQSGLEILH